MSYSRPTTHPLPNTFPRVGLGTAALYGFGAGIIGVAAMTIVEKGEQSLITHRPNSYVPAYTLLRLCGQSTTGLSSTELVKWNWIMHYGQGAVLGIVRAIMSYYGVRGPISDYIFTGMRLLNDQTLENITGVGALPWTWPVEEQWVDLIMKAVYAFTTGWIIDITV